MNKCGSYCKKFRRELWVFLILKNLTIKLRNWDATLIEFLIPLILLLPCVLVPSDEKYHEGIFKILNDINTQTILIIPLLCINIGRFVINQTAREVESGIMSTLISLNTG